MRERVENVAAPGAPLRRDTDGNIIWPASRFDGYPAQIAAICEVALAEGLGIEAVAIAAWEVLFDRPPALAGRRRDELRRAAQITDRILRQPGATAGLLTDLMLNVEEQHRTGRMEEHLPPPATLNWFVARVLKDARHRRRRWREARSGPAASGRDQGAPSG
jgi:hypothetical protein